VLLETSLMFKTFLILGIELGIVTFGCLLTLRLAKNAYLKEAPFWGVSFTGKQNKKGQLDLQPVDESSSGLRALTIVNMIALFSMVFTSGISLTVGLLTMTLTSLTLGPLLGFIMLDMDENDGLLALQLTAMITIAAGVIGMYSGIDFSFLRGFLFFALLGLILIRLVMLFTGFASGQRRLIAICGAALFTLFLLFDFTRLAKMQESGVNDWESALQIAISLYLDIINLLLEILDAMGN